MAFSVKSKKSGKTYFLHSKEVTLKGDRKQKIYYFAAEAKSNALNEMPAGYEVMENQRTGLPMLRKKK
jgi:YHS domain-containing protein